jgi:WD40 repeat protein
MWEVAGGRKLYEAGQPEDMTHHLTATTAAPGAALAAWSGRDGVIHLWQVPDARPARPAGDEGELVLDFGALSGSATIRRNGQVLRTLAVPQWQPLVVPLAPGDYAVDWSGTARGVELEPRQFRLAPGGQQVVGVRPRPDFVGEVRDVRADMGRGQVALLPDGRHALTARGDGTLVLWDLESGRALRDFRGHTGPVWGLAVTPDGKRAVSAGADGTLRVWDVATGQEQKYPGREMSFEDIKRIFRGEAVAAQSCRSDLGQASAGGLGLLPDGRQALCGVNERLVLVDLAGGKVVREWAAPAGQPVLSLALSPDGRRALTGHGDGGLVLWGVAAGKEEFSFPPHLQGVPSVAFSPDGLLALSVCPGGPARLWDVAARKELCRARVTGFQAGAVAFTPDSKHFFLSWGDNPVQVWDAAAREEVYRFAGFPGTAAGVAFADGGRRVVLCGGAGLAVRQLPGPDHDEGQLLVESQGDNPIVQVKRQGQAMRTLYPSSGAGQYCDMKVGDYELELGPGTPQGLRLWPQRVSVKAGRQQVVRVFRAVTPLVRPDPQRQAAADKELIALLKREQDARTDREKLRADLLDYVRNYRGLVPAHALEAAATLRRLPSPLDRLDRDKIPPELLTRVGGRQARLAPRGLVAVLGEGGNPGKGQAAVRALAFRGDGAVLAIGSAEGRLTLWDTATAAPLRSWEAHPGGVRAVAFSPDGKTVASGGADRRAVLWDGTTGKKLRDLPGPAAAVRAVAVSPDGRWVAIGGADGRVLLSPTNGEPAKLLDALGGTPVADLAFSPDGSRLAGGFLDGTIRLWDVETRTLKQNVSGHAGRVQGLAFSPDGNLLAFAGGWNAVVLWESVTGALVRTLPTDRPAAVHCLAFRPDGREVAAAASDGSVLLWDAGTAEVTDAVMLPSALNSIVQVAYSPDGRHLAVGHNGLVSILRLAPAVKKP